MPGVTLRLTVPPDYDFRRDACSYGYFLLAPNAWDPSSCEMRTAITLPGATAFLVISQPTPKGKRSARGASLRVRADRALDTSERKIVREQITRMLRLDEDTGVIRAFHRVDPRWKRSGRGRLLRSPTLFQDVVRTVTSCNVTWPGTVTMNERLCEVLGGGAFPTPRRLARARPSTLRARCRVGYRDRRLVELADVFVSGGVDEAWLESPETSDADVEKFLRTLPGVGPYAAANIMQLLGRYSRVPCDTETVRHVRHALGWDGDDRALMKRASEHYSAFGAHTFRSYWFELWAFYESKRGKSWTWEPRTTGRTFTASALSA